MIIGALALLSAPAAFAADAALELSWSGCPGDLGAGTNTNFTCLITETARLYGTFKSAVAIPNWVSMDVLIDVEEEKLPADQHPLSPFYRWDVGGCNAAGRAIGLAPDPLSIGLCSGFNNVAGVGGVDGNATITTFGADFPQSGRGRFIISVQRGSNDPFSIQAKKNHFAFVMTFNSGSSSSCAGCGRPLSMVWNTAILRGNDGSAVTIEGTSCATLNGASSGACSSTPARNMTWGRLKSLYR